MSERALTLRKAAEIIGVHHVTLRRWIACGEGPPAFIKPNPLGNPTIRIPRDGFDRWRRIYTEGRVA